ncbi:uncharacterized protein LOC131320847 [Rhododendron vialii]|uniref:uncharacterized protein LOC131320847 n=1 Tax=Rhododendron vialii TaxID=182163 RepID=UPI00265E455A|nr:uncharacterized protein LOC131320847 [Rhododendron vialii]
MSHPKGSIAKGYLTEQCLTFCARYLHDVETKLSRPIRNYDGEHGGRGLGKGKLFELDNIAWAQAHRYVLANSDVIAPFREEHIQVLRNDSCQLRECDLMRKHNEQFSNWFRDHVQDLLRTKNVNISDELSVLASAPNKWARRYTGYIINGFRFHTKEREERRKTQNSGVSLTAYTQSYASSRDKRPVTGEVIFYGVLRDIIELRYSNDFKFVLFKCDWVDNNVGTRQDEFKFTLVNFRHLLYRHNRTSDEPFILASQAQQVWYVQDPIDEDWHVVVKMTPRDLYDMNGKKSTEDEITCPQAEPYSGQQLDDVTYTLDNDVNWVRTDVEGVTVDDDIDGDDYDNVGAEDNDEEVDYGDEEEVDYGDEEEDCTDDDDDDFEENDEDGDHDKND